MGRLSKLMYLLLGVFTIGASLAALIAILFAPFSGKETRKKIADISRNLVSRQRRMLEQQAATLRAKREKQNWFKRLVA